MREIEIVQLFLSKGANVNHKLSYGDGWTCLFVAVYNKHSALVELLLEHGADWKIKDKRDRTPMDLAIEMRAPPEFLKFLQDRFQ